MKKRIHLKTGISDSEWFRLAVVEAQSDPVGMWEMVKVGRQSFQLEGEELQSFVRDFIVAMVQSGAKPIIGDKLATFGWSPLGDQNTDPNTVAKLLITDWKTSQADPDAGGVWFAFPSVFT